MSDEFGSFVTVAPSDDPLATPFSPFSMEGFGEIGAGSSSSGGAVTASVPATTTTTTITPGSTATSSAIGPPKHARNTSLSFLDSFNQVAAQAPVSSSSGAGAGGEKKRDLLDELLMADEDPMFLFNNSKPSTSITTSTSDQPATGPDQSRPREADPEILARPDDGEKGLTASLADLDVDFFSPTKATFTIPPTGAAESSTASTINTSGKPPNPIKIPQSQHHHHHPIGSLGSFVGSPTRSPTLTHATLAPPVTTSTSPSALVYTDEPAESTWLVPSDVAGDTTSQQHHRPPLSTSHAAAPGGMKPTSYQTLSNISAKWISSFLPHNTDGTGTHPADSFDTHRPGHRRTSTSNSLSIPAAPHAPSHSHTVGGGVTSIGTSPFGAHVPTIAPSGAPGFKREYDWDLGGKFAKELDEELASVSVSAGTSGIHTREGSSLANSFVATDIGVVPAGVGEGDLLGVPELSPSVTSVVSTTPTSNTSASLSAHSYTVSTTSTSGGWPSSSAQRRSKSPSPSPGTSAAPLAPSLSRSISGNAATATGVGVDVGTLMEKRKGGVELKGRKEMTVPVLEKEVADLVGYEL
jgi:hypothetical protein